LFRRIDPILMPLGLMLGGKITLPTKKRKGVPTVKSHDKGWGYSMGVIIVIIITITFLMVDTWRSVESLTFWEAMGTCPFQEHINV